jgi:hypothetical protein
VVLVQIRQELLIALRGTAVILLSGVVAVAAPTALVAADGQAPETTSVAAARRAAREQVLAELGAYSKVAVAVDPTAATEEPEALLVAVEAAAVALGRVALAVPAIALLLEWCDACTCY